MDDFLQDSGSSGLENDLARQRCVARDEFVATLAGKIEGRTDRARRRRIGGFVALTGVALVALGASGGGIYAYSASTPAKKTSGVHINQTNKIQRPESSSRAQYGPVPVPPHPKPKPPQPQPPPPPPPFTPPGKPGAGGGGSGSGGGGTSGGGQTGGGGQSGGGGQTGGGVAGAGGSNGQGSGLPFTGLSLVVPVVLGAGLIAGGLALRRRGRVTPE